MDLKPFAGMSQEETNYAILGALLAILDKLPRTDANDRVMISGTEVTQTVAVATNQTLSTLTDLVRVNTFGSAAATAKPADAIPVHLANIGALHIYDNIKVS